MNQQPCESYTEWMSLALDGMLGPTESRLLHGHIASCPSCAATWEAMRRVSSMLRAAPVAEPQPGFVARFEARLAYQAEQRRRTLVWMVLALGAVVLVLLALPSLLGVLRLTGQLVLPYRVIAYAQDTMDWLYLVSNALVEASWTLVRSACTGPSASACLLLAAAAAAALVLWTRMVVSRLTGQRVR
jgi:predicted anti-sigma-YlaC factor YlaD